MNILKNSLALGALLVGAITANATLDVVQFPSAQFVDPSNPMGNYRYYNQDWGWQHSAIAGTITSASLQISAYDVDWSASSSGEHDNIYAWKAGTMTLLGELAGANDVWAYTTFTLDSSWFADINAGLQLFIDIDSTHNSNTWAVSLAKSALTTDGSAPPPPQPGVVPEPSTVIAGALLLLPFGMQGIRLLRSRKQAV